MADVRPILAAMAAAALLGCNAPDAAVAPVSDEARASPPPRLTETALFDEALASAAPDAERLSADQAALAARAAALRARAAGLASPVLTDAARPRLEAAAGG